MRTFVCSLVATALLAGAGLAAERFRLAPFKDGIFKLPKTLASNADGSYVVVEFDPKRDIDGRDLVPEKQAKPQYVSLDVNRTRQDLVLHDGKVNVPFVEIGDLTKPARAAVIFVHGNNGNRFQGVDDGTFGGNFNRLKNLVAKSGGIYLSPGLSDAKLGGTAEVKLLMLEFAGRSPGAPIFLVCASNGGNICWRLIRDPKVTGLITGVLLVGATADFDFPDTPVGKAKRIPIYVGHGNKDKVIAWEKQDKFYKTMRNLLPGYPLRVVIFDKGAHGTPMRMTDWRQVINWMLDVNGG
jgi:hypothetical protein